MLTPSENAVKYFNRYNKLKRTFEADSKLIEETKAENTASGNLMHLDIAVNEEDLVELKEEVIQQVTLQKARRQKGKSDE